MIAESGSVGNEVFVSERFFLNADWADQGDFGGPEIGFLGLSFFVLFRVN